VRAAAQPLPGNQHDHDALMDLVGDAPLVLLGEASHGTHEFYRERARITRRLIVEKQFTALAVEGDWPDAYRVNRFARGRGADADAHGDSAVLVGFCTHTGTVRAATDWEGEAECKRVNPSRPDSIEGLLHATGLPRFLLPLRGDAALARALHEPRLQRAIGVIYRPETERWSHYFHSRVAQQFDALVHLDDTRAIDPLPPRLAAPENEAPDTFPSGL
jgi:erythromycin esterase-like protein